MAVAPGERDGLANILFEATLAGARALAPLWRKTVNVAAKADGSLVSAADHAADDAVRRALAEAALGWPLVSEESHEPGQRPPDRYLLLDPLDGTNEFLAHGAEFCVCLAAIVKGRPVAGAIVAPALARGWLGGKGAEVVMLDASLRERDRAPARGGEHGGDGLVGLASRRFGDARSDADLARCGIARRIDMSSAIKYGYLAEGKADIHVRHGRTMAWDIAAGDAILTAAGGAIRRLDGQPLDFSGQGGAFGNPAFVAVSRAALLPKVLAAMREDPQAGSRG